MLTLAKVESLETGDALARIADVAAALDVRGLDYAKRVASSLPTRLGGLPAEVTLALAEVATRLTHRELALPGDLDALDGAAASAWDRVTLSLQPGASRGWTDLRILRALVGGDVSAVNRPAVLLRRCAGGSDPDLALLALAWTRDAVSHCSLEPAAALDIVENLAAHGTVVVRAAAVRSLQDAWLASSPPDRRAAIARSVVDDTDEVALAALELIASVGDPRLLRRYVESAVPAVAARALCLLGRCGDAADLQAALETDNAGPELRDHVLSMHRRGIFPPTGSASALLDHFRAHSSWTADELNRVSFTIRDEVLTSLAGVDANDPQWRRMALLLPGCEGRRGESRAGDLLRARLSETRDEDTAEALLRAAAEAPEAGAELAILKWLDRLPEPSLKALRLHGGRAATEALLQRLEDALAFGSARRQALDALWWIAEDPSEVLGRVDPRELTAAQAAPRLASSSTVERVLLQLTDTTAVQQFSAIVALGANAQGQRLQTFFRRALSEELERRSPGRQRREPTMETEEQARRFGAHLSACGRRPGRYGDDDDAAWLRSQCLDWLAECLESDDARLAKHLLDVLRRCGLRRGHLGYVHRLWRHDDVGVRRAAMETLVDTAAAGLSLSLCSLASTSDLGASRQALRAIATFEAHWAEPLAIEALASPNMNLKKAASDALVVVGSDRCLSAVVDWLGRSDNPGLRCSLLGALDHIAGDATNSLLVDAFELARGDRAAMLLRALDRRLTSDQLLGLLRARRRAGPALRKAVLDAELTLADGNEAFRRAIHEAVQPGADLRSAAIATFSSRAFSTTSASELVEALEDVPSSLIVARLAEWAEWSLALEGERARRVGVVILRAVATRGRAFDVSERACAASVLHLSPQMQTAAERGAALAALDTLASADPKTKYRALTVTRRLGAVDPSRRWRVLRCLGGGTREDLERCLADARSGASTVAFLRFALELRDGHEFLLEDLPAVSSEAWPLALDTLLDAHPLGVSRPARRPQAARAEPSRAALLSQLVTDDGAAEAARELLADPEASSAWPRVLECYLEGGFVLQNAKTLASVLVEWPKEPEPAKRAAALVRYLPPHRRRAWIRSWLDQWSEGDEAAADALSHTAREDLVAVLAERQALDDESWVRVLDLCAPADSALASLQAERLRAAHPLLVAPEEHEEQEADPLLDLHDAPALIDYVEAKRGHDAAAAVGRLGLLGRDGLDGLLRATEHADSLVRTVALRWLRRVASKSTRLQAALAMLRVERQRDLRRQLVRVLAYGRHAPSYPLLIQFLSDSDDALARHADEALLRVGPPLLPALRKASARARPDRREAIESLAQRIVDAEEAELSM